MSKFDRDDPSRDLGSRQRENDWRDRGREWGRRDERYGQAQQRRDDDYSASDYRGEYRSPRSSAEDRDDYRDPSRYGREDRDDNPSGHSGSSSGGYSGYYGSSASRDAGRYPERSSVAERYPYVRGVYQEQSWSRDPRTGDVRGYDYEARWPSSGAGSDAYHRPVRWRSETELREREASSGERAWNNPERRFGNYGKGPKGYVRSDDRIREDVCDRLSDDDELDASEVTVTVMGGEVRLEGTVLDRFSKHRAEDLAESVSGVRDVTNSLRARKGFFQEIGDKLSGDARTEHRGHAGSGTHSAPNQNPPVQNSTLGNSSKGGMSANR